LERSHSWRRSPSPRSLIWLPSSSLGPSTLIAQLSAFLSLASWILCATASFQLRERFSFRILEPSVQLLCTCYTRGTGTSHTSVHDRAFCTSRSNLSSSRFRYDAF
jgi:hypothetical protein